MTVRLRVVDTITSRGGVDSLRLQGLPVGPWVWANTGTAPHLVGTANVSGSATVGAVRMARRGRRRVVLVVGGDVVTGPVVHPGAPGRHVWRAVAAAVTDGSPDVVRAAVHQAVVHG